MALGLGAGLAGARAMRVAREDVEDVGDGLIVRSRHPTVRDVPVRHCHEDRIRRLVASTSPGGLLCGATGYWTPKNGKRTDNLGGLKAGAPGFFDGARLRNTWIAAHLRAGVPVHFLLRAAGYTPKTAIEFLAADLPIDERAYRDKLWAT